MAFLSGIRLIRAGWVLLREGVTRLANPETVPPNIRPILAFLRLFEKGSVKRSNNAERLTKALNRLGPTYVKIGQFLATRPDIVGKDIAANLAMLQDRLPPFDTQIARQAIEATYGKTCEELFESFSEPIAAASIAQVHKASWKDEEGRVRDIAVKVLRPNVRTRFKNDLDTFMLGAKLAERLVPGMKRLRPTAAIETHARSAELELDLRLEAAALSELNENMASTPLYRTPDIIWRFMSRDILVTEWIEGTKLSRLDEVEAEGHNLKDLAARVIGSFLTQAVRDGFFHADMHPGNLFVEADGTLVAIDGGIMGRINRQESRFLAEILWGFINRDYHRIAEVHFEAGYVPAKHKVEDFAQALRGIGEPIHGVNAQDISMARLLQQLLDVTDLFDMPLQPQLIFLQRTMVVAEGLSRALDPQFNMWKAAQPVLEEWVRDEIGPAAHLRRTAKGVGTLAQLLGDLPKLAERAEVISKALAQTSREEAANLARARQNQIKAQKIGNRGIWALAGSILVLAAAVWWG